MRRVTENDRTKVYCLNAIDTAVSRYNERNKATANLKIEVDRFCGDYMEVKVRVCDGFATCKKLKTEDCLKGLENETVYIVNPSFIPRYRKQKWYSNYYDCLRRRNDGTTCFVDANGNEYTF